MSPDGQRVAEVSDKWVKIRRADAAGAPLSLDHGAAQVVAFAWSESGELLATADHQGTMRIWDSRAGYTVAADRRADAEVIGLRWDGEDLRVIPTLDAAADAPAWELPRAATEDDWRALQERCGYHLVAGDLLSR